MSPIVSTSEISERRPPPADPRLFDTIEGQPRRTTSTGLPVYLLGSDWHSGTIGPVVGKHCSRCGTLMVVEVRHQSGYDIATGEPIAGEVWAVCPKRCWWRRGHDVGQLYRR
jgi:hypothetical protein